MTTATQRRRIPALPTAIAAFGFVAIAGFPIALMVLYAADAIGAAPADKPVLVTATTLLIILTGIAFITYGIWKIKHRKTTKRRKPAATRRGNRR